MGHITDSDRKKLEEALAAALLLLYIQVATEQYDQLGADSSEPSDEAKQKIAAMAAETALLMQQGINQRLADADNPETVQGEIKDYNESVLLPFLTSWVTHQAISDVYDAVPNPDNPDQSMKDAVQWEWQKFLDYEDDCQLAADASPASYDELVQIAGSAPPAHRNCPCQLTPIVG